MPDKVYVGRKVQSFQSFGEYKPFTGVKLWRDDETYFFAGDDTGRVLENTHRSATQAMADRILEGIKGYVYRPYEAKGAELDPAAEVGDGVTVCGIYSVLGSIRKHYDALGLCDISAPGGKEIDHEYPYKSPQDRELKRRVKLEQSYYGAKISRREGLVIEKVIGEAIAAKVVLNAEKFAFYDGDGKEQLYFDPAAGCYKFRGALNVNDNFIVDKLGNVTLNGSIKWGVGNEPNKKRYAAGTSGPWHETMLSGDLYCCDWDYVGETWGEPYQFVGRDGRPGSDGTDGNPKKYLEEIGITELTDSLVKAPHIKGGLVEGGELRVTGAIISRDRGISELGIYDDSGHKYGYIRFDDHGSGPYEAPKRMFICTEFGKAMKIQSGGDLSITAGADGAIYLGSKVVFKDPPTAVFA